MKIAVLGGYGIGMTMRVQSAPSAGETVSGGVLSVGPGGKGSNQAIAAARLGASVSLLTTVGPDAAGDAGRALWSRENVDDSIVPVATAPTMTGFITVDASGENRISIAPGALDELGVDAAERFSAHIRAADVLLVSLEIPIPVAAAALRIAREFGTRTILNPAPACALPDSMWDCVDVLTPNLAEAAVLLDDAGSTDDPNSLARRLAQRFGCTVVLTMGAGGALIHDGTAETTVEAVAVDTVVDTAGAGDAFSAALAFGLAAGRPIHEAARFAVHAGAYAVGFAEVVPGLPTSSALEERWPALREGALT